MAVKSKSTVRLPSGQSLSLKEFKRQVSALKKAGVVSKHTDVRSVKPTRYFRRLVSRNQDVIKGRAQAVLVPTEVSRQYAEHGFRVKNARVILPSDERTSYIVREGRIEARAKTKGGDIEYIKIPIKFQNMEQFLEDLKKAAPDLDKKIGKGYRVGFRYYGNFSLFTFPTFFALVDYLSRYETIADGQEDMQDFLNLEFVKTPNDKLPANPRQPKPPRFVPYKKKRESIRKNPQREAKYQEYRRRKEKARRTRMTEVERHADSAKRIARRNRKK